MSTRLRQCLVSVQLSASHIIGAHLSKSVLVQIVFGLPLLSCSILSLHTS